MALRAIFWNPGEARIRAFWRVFVQFAVLVVLVLATRQLLLSASGSVPGWLLALVELVITLAVVGLATRFLDRRRLVDIGLHLDRRWWLDLGVGVVLGGLLMAGIFAVEWVAGWITVVEVAPSGALLWALAALPITVMAAASEELLSRGYQMKNAAEGLCSARVGPRAAIALGLIATSLFFGLGHVGGPHSGLDSFLVLSAVGVLFAVSYLVTGELGLCIGLHAGWNRFQGGVFGFSVSGHEATESFVAITQGGPPLWTGGSTGRKPGCSGWLRASSALSWCWGGCGCRGASWPCGPR